MQTCTYNVGESDDRPWGSWLVLEISPGTVIKKITVSPGQRLSLQSHEHRREKWVVIQGDATVELDGIEHAVPQGQAIDIPLGVKHRLTNETHENVVIVEFQFGDILCEEDIIRYDDEYGRGNG